MLNGVIMKLLFNNISKMMHVRRVGGLFVALAIIFLMAKDVSAQVAMRLDINHKVYMQYEEIIATLTMRNFSARPLIFGRSDKFKGTISFTVFKGGKMIVGDNARRFDLEGLLLSPGETRSLKFNLSKKFKLKDTGLYEIQSFLSHSLLADKYMSNKRTFRIDRGATLWTRTVGIPDFLSKASPKQDPKKDSKKDNRSPSEVIRSAKINKSVKYSINSLFENGGKVLYLTVEDDKHIYAVKRIGVEMSEVIPWCEIDICSSIHILLRTTPRIYSYFNFDTKGRVLEHKVLKTDKGVPVLVVSRTGIVQVVGGSEIVSKKKPVNPVEEPFKDVIKK